MAPKGWFAEIAKNIGKALEPIDVVAAHVALGMAEMIEPAIWPGHAAGDGGDEVVRAVAGASVPR